MGNGFIITKTGHGGKKRMAKKDERLIKIINKKTVYIEKELEKKLKIQAVVEEKTESNLLNEILGEYFEFMDGQKK